MQYTRSITQRGQGYAHLKNGFALIVTLTLLFLLAVVVLAMLSLATVEMRASQDADAQSIARANARLALVEAIGQLQKLAGPDQRVTTSAATFGDGDPSKIEHPHYLAVFDSWDTFLNEKKYLRDKEGKPTTQTLSIQDTYKNGRHPSLFRGYLVSNQNPELLSKINAATDSGVLSLDDTDSVLLVSAGSKAKDKTVRAGLLGLRQGSRITGRIAWWVGGLNSRPAIDIEKQSSADNSLAGSRAFAAEPQGPDISGMEGLENFPDNAADKSKLVSVQQGAIIAPDRDAYRANSLNLGAGGQWSLLTDVRGSGMKKDLNSFFDNALPSEYKSTSFMGVDIETPLRSVNGLNQLGVIEKNIPPTSWRQLKDYYSLYLQDTTNPNYLNYKQAHLLWESGAPVTQAFMAAGTETLNDIVPNNHDTLSYARMPVIARWLYIFALSSKEAPPTNPASGSKQYDLFLHTYPVMVLWNPYNVQLKIETRGMGSQVPVAYPDSDFMIEPSFLRALKVEYKVYKKDASNESLTNWSDVKAPYMIAADGGDTNDSWYEDIFFTDTPSVGSITYPQRVMLKPGEVKIFSFDESSLTHAGFNYFSPGFSPGNLNGKEKLKFKVGQVSQGDTPSITLRFANQKSFGGLAKPRNSTMTGGPTTAFAMENLGTVFRNANGKVEKKSRYLRGGNTVEWLDQLGVKIIPDEVGERARWLSLGNEVPLPEAAVGMFLKSGTELAEGDGLDSSKDVRSRNWLHGNPSHPWRSLFRPDQLKRSNFPYELYYNGNLPGNSVASLLQSTSSNNAFIGTSIESSDGVSFFPYQEIPIAPATNLAELSGMRLTNGKTINEPMPVNHQGGWSRNNHYPSAWGAAFGHGIGNAYAHPMIQAKDIYTSYESHTNYTGAGQPVFANYWDTLLMANDALWDAWFCSSIAPQPTPAYGTKLTRATVLENFVNGTKSLPNHRLRLHHRKGQTENQAIAELKLPDAYRKMASHMMIRGGFNVNTASPDSWKAFLHGLQGRVVPVIDALSLNKSTIPSSEDELVLSRFGIATGSGDGNDPSNENAWRGIRRLDDAQIDSLAEQIAKQVRLRGPFLNMSDFINRRLSDDRFGVSGALQAAIDWDEFDNDYSGAESDSSGSINAGFKHDMISTPTADYVNKRAARGSRFAGIPGYVMQSDLLRAMGNVLTVRDDSFVIRAYGEALNSKGELTARAWCEAVVQRMPEYVIDDDGVNAPENSSYSLDNNNKPVPSATLSEINMRFGRQFKVKSFRWLSQDEVL